MSTTDLYEYWKEHFKSEGVKDGVRQGLEQGIRQSLETAYRVRFGPMPDEIAAAIAATQDAATLDRWLEIILTSTPEDVTRAVRARDTSS